MKELKPKTDNQIIMKAIFNAFIKVSKDKSLKEA